MYKSQSIGVAMATEQSINKPEQQRSRTSDICASPPGPNPMDLVLSRLEALCNAALSLDIDITDRVAAARSYLRHPMPEANKSDDTAVCRPSVGPLDDRINTLEMHIQRLVMRVSELRDLFG